jgi:hypothetical protein
VEERQTRGSQKALPSRACGFESRPGHLIAIAENAGRLSNELLVLRELVHLSSGHLAREPRFEVKALLGDHLHDDARAIGTLHARRTELGADPSAPSQELAALLDRANTDDSRQYLDIAYGELKPTLIAAVRIHLDRLDPLLDEPTYRLLTRLLHRQERHVAELPAGREHVAIDDLGALPLEPGERALRVLPRLDRPARDGFIAVVDRPEGGHAVHDLMNARLCAAELASRTSHERPDMPWEFHEDMARVCWDGVRHAEVLDRLMATELHCHWGDHPVALGAPTTTGLDGELPDEVASVEEYLRADDALHARIAARWAGSL